MVTARLLLATRGQWRPQQLSTEHSCAANGELSSCVEPGLVHEVLQAQGLLTGGSDSVGSGLVDLDHRRAWCYLRIARVDARQDVVLDESEEPGHAHVDAVGQVDDLQPRGLLLRWVHLSHLHTTTALTLFRRRQIIMLL